MLQGDHVVYFVMVQAEGHVGRCADQWGDHADLCRPRTPEVGWFHSTDPCKVRYTTLTAYRSKILVMSVAWSWGTVFLSQLFKLSDRLTDRAHPLIVFLS